MFIVMKSVLPTLVCSGSVIIEHTLCTVEKLTVVFASNIRLIIPITQPPTKIS